MEGAVEVEVEAEVEVDGVGGPRRVDCGEGGLRTGGRLGGFPGRERCVGESMKVRRSKGKERYEM